MSQNSFSSKRPVIASIVKFIGFCIPILALIWQIIASRSDKLAMEGQLHNQATQIAIQDVQIGLLSDQYRVQSELATITAEQFGVIVAQATLTSMQSNVPEWPTNDSIPNGENLDATATLLAEEAARLEATRQATEKRQQEILATQTAVAEQGLAPASNCQQTSDAHLPPFPSAPPNGCVLIVEWWVSTEANNCGILITFNAPELPNDAVGTWWYVYPTRPESHLREYEQKNSHCRVEDLR